MIDFVKKINKEIENRLQIIDLDEPNIISKSQKSVHYINNTLRKLKVFIANYSFKDKDEEIQFFKKIKPEIFSQLIYFVKIFNIESRRPLGSSEIQKKHLKYELKKLTFFL